MRHHQEPGVGFRALVVIDLDVGIADPDGAGGDHAGQVGDRGDQPAQLLHLLRLVAQRARFGNGGAIVVAGEHHRGGQPAPAGAAIGHVEALDADAVGEVGAVEDALEPLAALDGVAVIAAVRPPIVEPAAAKFSQEAGRVGRGGGAALRAARTIIAPIGRGRPARRLPLHRAGAAGIAVECIHVVGAGNDLVHRTAFRRPIAVAALVIVEDRHGDAVGARLGIEMVHVAPLRRGGQRQLIFDLVQDDAMFALGIGVDLMPGDDGVDMAEPLIGGLEIVGIVGAGAGALVDQPAGKAAARQFRIHIRAGARDDVEPLLLRHRQQPVEVADAGEVVDPLFRAVIAPVEIKGDGVEAARLHLLEDVAPQVGGGQAEGVEFAAPDDGPLAIDHQRARVIGDAAESLDRGGEIGGGARLLRERGQGGGERRAQQQGGDQGAHGACRQSMWNSSGSGHSRGWLPGCTSISGAI